MRLPMCALFAVLLLPVPMAPQSHEHPRPPGITEGQKQINQPLEPPLEMRNRQINVEQVQQESQELRRLADSIPDQIHQATNNQLPKDLSDNLKRIEKLAKHLRSQITP